MVKSSLHRIGTPGVFWTVALALIASGCGGFKPANKPLEKYDPTYGYRITGESTNFRDAGRTIVLIAFSGGGTRAAAFAYGVLEELRDTTVVIDGEEKRLLDEVDTISGVSGGSFPAAYYGLYGDRIFEDFEERFLKRNVQGALIRRTLLPWNLIGLMTPWLSRSDLAMRYYDKHIFEEATFGDLREAHGPRIHINATDLSSGNRITFNQEGFDVMCSDLDLLRISTAVAASSAVPMLLSPITLRNYAGTCGYVAPAWIQKIVDEGGDDPRQRKQLRTYLAMQDSKRKKYLHLVDGGISDNLGLRFSIDFVTAAGGAREAIALQEVEVPDRLVLIVVNAETDPDPAIDLASAAPSFASLMNSVSGGQIRRYNFETLLLVRGLVKQWGADLSTPERKVETFMIDVAFDEFDDADDRRYFKRIPTSFKLSDKHVDWLRDAGRTLLRDSPDYQRLLESLK
jgi:NTE family protein